MRDFVNLPNRNTVSVHMLQLFDGDKISDRLLTLISIHGNCTVSKVSDFHSVFVETH